MSLFEELKRRNVVRVGAAYAVVAWLLIQVIDTVFPRLGAPDWVVSVLMVLLILGFPVALVLAWAFEFTPAGIKTQQVADDTGQRSSGSKLNAVLIGSLALAVVFLVIDDYVLEDATPVQEPVALENSAPLDEITATANLEKSIAVLPFANLSNDPDQDYFSDGLTEELINKLSQVSDLQVTGRNSSFYYKDRDEDLRDIGQTLGVAHILQGSVRKNGNQIRISAQLMDVRNNFNLWSDTFDRDMTNIFALQDEIAEAITTALSITIRAGEFSLPGMTSNIEAYDEFLKARNDFYVFTSDTVLTAMDHIERAVSLDPQFVQGLVLMEEIYRTGPSMLPPDNAVNAEARRIFARDRVMALNPQEPRIVDFEVITLTRNGRWAEAEEKILEVLNPDNIEQPDMARGYAYFLQNVGRLQDALYYSLQARRLEPLDPETPWQLAQIYLGLGRMDDAADEIQRALSLEGLDQLLSGLMFMVALQTQDNREGGIAALEAMDPPPAPLLMETARLWQAGEDDEVLRRLEEIMFDDSNSPIDRVTHAEIAIDIGNPQLALDMVLQNPGQGLGIPGLWMPYFSEGRKLPDFKRLMEERGIADYWRATGNWADYCRPLAGNDDFECF